MAPSQPASRAQLDGKQGPTTSFNLIFFRNEQRCNFNIPRKKDMDAKKLARALHNAQKTAPLSYCQILELIAKADGAKNQNIAHARTKHTFGQEIYLHIDNGGYFFSWSQKTNTLRIRVSFFGYSEHVHDVFLDAQQQKAFISMLDPQPFKNGPDDESEEEETLHWNNETTKMTRSSYGQLSFELANQVVSLGLGFRRDVSQEFTAWCQQEFKV